MCEGRGNMRSPEVVDTLGDAELLFGAVWNRFRELALVSGCGLDASSDLLWSSALSSGFICWCFPLGASSPAPYCTQWRHKGLYLRHQHKFLKLCHRQRSLALELPCPFRSLRGYHQTTASPSFFSQLTTVPAVIVSLSLGISMIFAMM